MKYSLWLTLSEKDEDDLSRLITNLSREYAAPVFRPHCTVFSPWEGDPEELSANLNAERYGVFSAKMTRLNHSDWIWKTVFIELEPNRALTGIYNRVAAMTTHPYDFQPHISLIYKTLSSPQRERILKQLHPKPLYQFTALEIVETGGDVGEWNSRFRIPLGS